MAFIWQALASCLRFLIRKSPGNVSYGRFLQPHEGWILTGKGIRRGCCRRGRSDWNREVDIAIQQGWTKVPGMRQLRKDLKAGA